MLVYYTNCTFYNNRTICLRILPQFLKWNLTFKHKRICCIQIEEKACFIYLFLSNFYFHRNVRIFQGKMHRFSIIISFDKKKRLNHFSEKFFIYLEIWKISKNNNSVTMNVELLWMHTLKRNYWFGYLMIQYTLICVQYYYLH